MLSNSKKKFVNALKQKKFRQLHNSFVVEGVKMVEELLHANFEVTAIFGTPNWIAQNQNIEAIEVSNKELQSISSLKTPHEVLAVAVQKPTLDSNFQDQLILALDTVQDPGNLGTIIRTADWFGIKSIVCSSNSVDLYNPKVIQASMGSLFRVNIIYTDLANFFSQHQDLTVYGALLDGNNIYKEKIEPKNTVILMGNESKGISDDLLQFVTHPISIPKFGNAESLNVAVATAILCAEYKRN